VTFVAKNFENSG